MRFGPIEGSSVSWAVCLSRLIRRSWVGVKRIEPTFEQHSLNFDESDSQFGERSGQFDSRVKQVAPRG